MVGKIVIATLEEAKKYSLKYGADLAKHCQLTPQLERRIREYVQKELELLPEMANYHYRRDFEYQGRICKGGPHAKAEQFHNSLAAVRLVMGGKRSAKTYSAGQETACHVTHCYPSWWKGRRFYSPIRFRICAETYSKHIEPIIIPLLKKLIPANYITKWMSNQARQYTGFHTAAGDYCQFMNYDQERKDFESSSFHGVWLDEPPSREVYMANATRVIDTDGFLMLTGTVLRAHSWIIDELATGDAGNKDVFVVYFDVKDNPIITDKMVKKMESILLTDEERDARIHGIPQIFSGRAFKEYNEMVHVCPTFKCKPEDFTFYMAIDPHPREDWHLAWYAVNRQGMKYVINEAQADLKTYKNVAIEIAYKEGRITLEEQQQMRLWPQDQVRSKLWFLFHEKAGAINPFVRIMDTSGWTPDSSTGKPMANMLASYGIHCVQAIKAHDNAVSILHDWLNPTPAPMLVIQEHCVEHRWQIKNVVYGEYVSDTARERHDKLPTFREKRIHYVALLKYLANYNPQYYEKSWKRSNKREHRVVNSFAGI